MIVEWAAHLCVSCDTRGIVLNYQVRDAAVPFILAIVIAFSNVNKQQNISYGASGAILSCTQSVGDFSDFSEKSRELDWWKAKEQFGCLTILQFSDSQVICPFPLPNTIRDIIEQLLFLPRWWCLNFLPSKAADLTANVALTNTQLLISQLFHEFYLKYKQC